VVGRNRCRGKILKVVAQEKAAPECERRLLMLTPQDPYGTTPQSFNPFR
jgi:hypothetical protein